MERNFTNKRHHSASQIFRQSAFKLGVKDHRSGNPPREGANLPPLEGLPDSIDNREITYFRGRWAAAYCRASRCKLTVTALWRAGAERAVL